MSTKLASYCTNAETKSQVIIIIIIRNTGIYCNRKRKIGPRDVKLRRGHFID